MVRPVRVLVALGAHPRSLLSASHLPPLLRNLFFHHFIFILSPFHWNVTRSENPAATDILHTFSLLLALTTV